MGTMMRRVPGTPTWHVFKDGVKVGSVTQSQDGSWQTQAEGDVLSPPAIAGTRRDAARLLTGVTL